MFRKCWAVPLAPGSPDHCRQVLCLVFFGNQWVIGWYFPALACPIIRLLGQALNLWSVYCFLSHHFGRLSVHRDRHGGQGFGAAGKCKNGRWKTEHSWYTGLHLRRLNLTKDKRWRGQQLHGNIAPLYHPVLSEWLRTDCLVRDGQATVSGKPREGNQHLGSVHCRLHTSRADLLIKPWWHRLLPYFAWRPRAVSLFSLCLLPAFFLPFLQAHGGSEWQKWVQSYVCLTSEPEFLSITLCHIGT